MAGAQEPGQLPQPAMPMPMLSCRDLHQFLTLLGASVVVHSVVGKPCVHAGYVLAGFLLWLLGTVLLLFGRRLQPAFPGALAVAQEPGQLPQPAMPMPMLSRRALHQFLTLLGASVVVHSVVGKPCVHAGYVLAGFLLWLLGTVLLLFGRRLQPAFPGALAVAQEPGQLPQPAMPMPMLSCRALHQFLTLLGASVVVHSVVGKPCVHVGYVLAGFLLWLLGTVLLLFGRRLQPAFPGALAVAQEPGQLPQPAMPMPMLSCRALHQFLTLLGASVLVHSVVGKPSVHAGYVLAGFLLWLLGTVLLLFGRRLQPAFPGALAVAAANFTVEKVEAGRQEPAPPA